MYEVGMVLSTTGWGRDVAATQGATETETLQG